MPGRVCPRRVELAGELGVSRNTVTLAFDQLMAEGYLQARVGDETYVRGSLPDDLIRVNPTGATGAAEGCLRLSRHRDLLESAVSSAVRRPDHLRAFWPGLPDLDAFPTTIWSRLIERHVRRPDTSLLGYGDPAEYWPLREAIAAYLATTRVFAANRGMSSSCRAHRPP